MYLCMYECMYVHVYVCMAVGLYVCVYVFISIAFCGFLHNVLCSLMSFGPSSVAQPAADGWMDLQPHQHSNVDCAAQPEGFDVRWQVEYSSGHWWDIPFSAVIDAFFTESEPGIIYNYDYWEDGRFRRYVILFESRAHMTIDTRRERRVRRAFVEASVQALM